MLKIILFLSLIVIGCTIEKQPSLIGNWSTENVVYKSNIEVISTTIIYNRHNSDSIKNILFEKYKTENSLDSEFEQFDTTLFNENIKKTLKNFDLSSLKLKSDSTFFMENFGLIIPTDEAGWYFGDTIIGKWTTNKANNFILNLGNDKDSYNLNYKIIKLTKDSLIIGQINEFQEEPFQVIKFLRHLNIPSILGFILVMYTK